MQEVDNTLAHLARERAALDDGCKARTKQEALENDVREQKRRLDHLNEERGAHEADLELREDKLSKQEARLMSATNAHEVQSLERDIAALMEGRSSLDERILLLMDEIEEAATELNRLRTEHQEQDEALHEIESTFAAETTRINGEEAQLQAQREEKFANLSEIEKKKYENAATRHNGIAVAYNKNGACSACGTALTPYSLKAAKTEDWPTCESCGRLLFVENNT